MLKTVHDALGASPLKYRTITPAELGVILDLAVNANAPVGHALKHRDLFDRLVALANSQFPIGSIEPITEPIRLTAE